MEVEMNSAHRSGTENVHILEGLPIPADLLPHIFYFLSTNDRKNVRLTCHQWNEACNRKKIMELEKFSFHLGNGGDDMQSLGASIIRCGTLRSRIEFDNLHLRLLPRTVWRVCGHRIESLHIYDCEIDEETIADVIRHCTQLVFFRLVRSTYEPRQFFTGHTLDFLIAQGVKQKVLTHLELYYSSKNEKLSLSYPRLFQIYPNIRSFGIGHYRHQIDPAMSFVIPPNVESFTCKSQAPCTWMAPFVQNPSAKFKRLRITLMGEISVNHCEAFLSKQTELEEISLTVQTEDTQLATALLFLIMKYTPKLKNLKFRTRSNIDFSIHTLGEFIKNVTRLTSLDLDFLDLAQEFLPTDVLQLPSSEFNKLVQLRFVTRAHAENYHLVLQDFLKRCCSLRCLQLQNIHRDETLGIILKCRTLRCLHFRYLEVKILQAVLINQVEYYIQSKRLNPLHEQNMRNSFERFQNLEYLEVNPQLSDAQFINSFISFKDTPSVPGSGPLVEGNVQPFPSRADDIENLMYESLNIVSLRVPGLEELGFDMDFVEHSLFEYQLVDFCKRLTKLKYFVGYIADMNVKPLFIECPSLMSVSDLHTRTTYYYNRLTKTMKKYCYKPFNKTFRHDI